MMNSLTDSILTGASESWNAVMQHRFFREVAGDALGTDRWIRYLGIEYAFIDTAALVLGYAITKAPSFAERQKLSLGLYGLVTDQERFFQAAFDSLGLPKNGLRPHHSLRLHALFLEAASTGSYFDILATIFGAEWLYLHWCRAANQTPSARDTLRQWVELHAGGSFQSHVYWVKAELDSAILSPSEAARIEQLFQETLEAEKAFHDAVYEDD